MRPASNKRSVVAAALLAGLLATSAGCSAAAPGTQLAPSPVAVTAPSETMQHGDDHGSLVVDSAQGSTLSIEPPGGRQRWKSSFGIFLMCVEGGGTATLTGVTMHPRGGLLNESVWLRRDTSSNGLTRRGSYEDAYGTPPDYSEPYANQRFLGAYTQGIRGAHVSTPCSGTVGVWPHRYRYNSLVFALSAGPRGGAIWASTVHYLLNGVPRQYRITFHLVACGRGGEYPDVCAK